MTKERQTVTKRTEQSQQTKQALLTASLDLFVHQGYSGTTIRDIATRANVSPGLMFHYFASKQAILQEHAILVGDTMDRVGAMLSASSTPLATFREIANLTLESFKQDFSRKLFLLANQIMSFDSIPKEAKAMVSPTQSIALSLPLLKQGQQNGEIKQGEPMALAVAFWGTLQGIAEILIWNPQAAIPTAEQVVSLLVP